MIEFLDDLAELIWIRTLIRAVGKGVRYIFFSIFRRNIKWKKLSGDDVRQDFFNALVGYFATGLLFILFVFLSILI